MHVLRIFLKKKDNLNFGIELKNYISHDITLIKP